jgi:hypothetical protein
MNLVRARLTVIEPRTISLRFLADLSDALSVSQFDRATDLQFVESAPGLASSFVFEQNPTVNGARFVRSDGVEVYLQRWVVGARWLPNLAGDRYPGFREGLLPALYTVTRAIASLRGAEHYHVANVVYSNQVAGLKPAELFQSPVTIPDRAVDSFALGFAEGESTDVRFELHSNPREEQLTHEVTYSAGCTIGESDPLTEVVRVHDVVNEFFQSTLSPLGRTYWNTQK